MTRRPLEAALVAALDCAVGAALLAAALAHAPRRAVLAHFAVYGIVIFLFKARGAAARAQTLVELARRPPAAAGPWWLRAPRLLLGYDTWSRTERLGLVAIAAIVCTLFGWDDGAPFAAAAFLAVGTLDLLLALTAGIASRR